MVANDGIVYSELQTKDNRNMSDDAHQKNESKLLEGDDIEDDNVAVNDLSNVSRAKNLDDVISNFAFGLFHVKIMLVTCGAYFALCSELIVFVFLSTHLKKEWNLDDYIFPLLPLFGGIGGIIGEYFGGTLSDRFGRKKVFLASLFQISVFGLLSAFSVSFVMYTVLRFLVFVGVGALAAVDFVLLLEFLPRKKRGTCMIAITFSGALGALFASGMAWLFLPGGQWRLFVGACAIPAIIVVIYSVFLVEESPRYLFLSDQESQGLAIISKIDKQNTADIPNSQIICPPQQKRGRFGDLFMKGNCLKTIMLGLVWFLQATGYWGVTVYLPVYMKSQGIDPYFNMFTIFVGELPGLVLAMILIEPYMLGRVRCLQFFSFGTLVSLLIFAFVRVTFLKAVFVIVCYFFMVPIYSILNTYSPEVYPTIIRSTAMAVFNMIIEIPGLVTPFVGEYLIKNDQDWVYPVVWASFFFLQVLCSLGLKNETAGKTLQDQSPNENTGDKISESSHL